MIILKNSANELLLERRPPTGIWGGLWCFPQCENENEIKQIAKQMKLTIKTQINLPKFTHTFTHFKLDIQPILLSVTQSPSRTVAETNTIWYHPSHTDQQKIGLPQPIKKLMANMIDDD